MAKWSKQGKKNLERGSKPENQSEKKVNLSGEFLSTMKDALSDFSKIPEEERVSLYGDQEFLDQFWEYFKKECPDLLSGVKKEDMPKYLSELEKKGFSVATLSQNADKLHKEFASEKSEREVMQETLATFDTFCKGKVNNIPDGTFKKFANEAGFDDQSYTIPRGSKLTSIDTLYLFWKSFAEKEGIKLQDNQKKNIEHVLCPDYTPVERIMVEIAITEIKKILPAKLRADFTTQFPLPLTAFSALGDLRNFKIAWMHFLEDHASDIDASLAKKLDNVRVSNGSIKRYILASGKKFDLTKGYEEWERYFLRTFNTLATRQLFEETKETKQAIEKYIDVIADTVKGFPPYVNELFNIYPYHDKEVSAKTPGFHDQVQGIDKRISEIELAIANETTQQEERNSLHKQRQQLIQEREQVRWAAYVLYLSEKDKALSTVVGKLVGAHFDFAQLSVDDQQLLLQTLVKHKLDDLIAHQAPELLGIDAKDLKQFTDDLFDLSKKDLLLPTREGPVHIVFREKKFLAQQVDQLLSVNELAQIKTLPLQFVVEQTSSSQEFFEENILRGKDGGQLFDTFQAKNGPIILNDGYKVRISKNGKTVEGYLSQEAPTDVDMQDSGETRYLYSEPVTSVTKTRKRITREGTDQGTPVTIEKNEEQDCSLQVLDRSFALNGEAIGSLIFAYVLGQQGMVKNMSIQKEKELATKIGKLEKFVDKNYPVVSADPVVEEKPASLQEQRELSDYEKFLEERGHLSGYSFPEDGKRGGFKEGTRLYIELGETALPPDTTGGLRRMQLEIVKIDQQKGTFTFKVHDGETISGYAGHTKEIPLQASSLDKLKEIFGKNMYKVPPTSKDLPATLDILKKSGFDTLYKENFACTFDTINWDRGYKFVTGDFVGESVASFGTDVEEFDYDEKQGRTITKLKTISYKVSYLSNGKVKISHEFSDGKNPRTWSREMDYPNFILFVAGKKLQPQPDSEKKKGKDIKTKNDSPDREPKKAKMKFSINNIAAFFKNGLGKIKDGIKKYDEERAEELTDLVLKNGQALEKFGKMWGGLSKRIGEGFETAGLEYYTTRDSRIWKKIERWQKYYEQEAHYPSFFFDKLKPMLDGKETPKDIYKIPAMLLTIINKEKDPYARSPQLIGTGHRVNLMLGKANQERYLSILNKKKEELRQNSAIYGTNWAVMKNEEIVKLEMKYIISVIDGREHAIQDKGLYEKAMAAKWSRAFAGKLDEALGKYGFGETAKKANDIPMSMTFEFAEYEFSRNVKANKSASALPNLKGMAKLAQTERQREIFQMHIVSCVLSGYFWRTLDAESKGWIKDICRTRGFLPGLRAKDLNQQTKMQKLLDIYSRGNFTSTMEFKSEAYTFGKMDKFGGFVHEGFKNRWLDDDNGHKFCKFLEMTGNNVDGKKLIDLSQDPALPNDQRALLQEYIHMGEETSEDIDKDVKNNPSALRGTPFTKCETVVKEMMRYDGQEFAGTASNEKAGPSLFWRNVTQGLPTHKIESVASIEFFVRKFMNRFGGCGFTGGQQPTIFLKRLATVKELIKNHRTQEADDMLWYIINGTIINGNSYGKDTPPKEFEDALDAFKLFFKNNLDKILSPSMITNTLGEIYAKDDEAKTPYELGNWEEYIRYVKTKGSMAGLSQEEKKESARVKEKYRLVDYEIYDQLYRDAESLETRHGKRNIFRKYYSAKGALKKNSESGEKKTLNAKGVIISNPQIKKQTSEDLQETMQGRKFRKNIDEDEDDLEDEDEYPGYFA